MEESSQNPVLREISELQFNNLTKSSRVVLGRSYESVNINDTLIQFPVNFNHMYRNPGTSVKPVNFRDCTFKENVSVGLATDTGIINFYNCTFQKDLNYHQTNFTQLQSCLFQGNLTLNLGASREETKISALNVSKLLTIKGETSSLTLHDINFFEKIDLQEIYVKITGSGIDIKNLKGAKLIIINSVIENDLVIENALVNAFNLKKTTANGSIKINNSELGAVSFSEIKGNQRKIDIEESNITHLNLDSKTFEKIAIKNKKTDFLTISGTSENDTSINLNNVEIIKLAFDDCHNKGFISLREVRITEEGIISFLSSNLGKIDFIHCDFSKAKMEFENSKLTEAFLSETEFPSKIELKGVANHSQAQLAFGQIVAAYQKQGDTINALEYNSRELEAHYSKLKETPNGNRFTKFNLWLNLISNNFGRSWSRAVLFSFALGILSFIALVFATGYYGVRGSFDWNLLGAFFKFMNPLRFFELPDLFKTTSIGPDRHLNPACYLIDFFGRVIVAYGFYQTIQAFRRFGRK